MTTRHKRHKERVPIIAHCRRRAASAAVLLLALPACDRAEHDRQQPMETPGTTVDKINTSDDGEKTMSMAISSTAFAAGETIPVRYTGDGDDISPALAFANIPANTLELALICDDPDAPTPQPWVHWIIYKIPSTASGLAEAVPTTKSPTTPAGTLQGVNSWDKIGYGGPAPPPGHGTHHYHFKLYALDIQLDAQAGMTKNELLTAIQGHVLEQAELVGTYER